jgi:hypothetical protein
MDKLIVHLMKINILEVDLIYFCCFSATFNNILATSFSVGGSRSTRREPPTMGKQLVNFITCGCEIF